MWEIWKERRGALEQEKVKVRARHQLGVPVVAAYPDVRGAARAVGPAEDPRVSTILLEAIVNITEGLRTLLSSSAIEHLSQDELAALRPRADTLHQLSVCLDALHARLMASDTEHGGAP